MIKWIILLQVTVLFIHHFVLAIISNDTDCYSLYGLEDQVLEKNIDIKNTFMQYIDSGQAYYSAQLLTYDE